MDFSDVFLQNIFGFAAALIGGIIGGFFTLRATDKAIRNASEKETRQEEREVQNLLDALGVEISTLWGFHMRRIGQLVEHLPEGGALEFYYPLTQDYFTIYNSNAVLIGRVQDPALREAIVVCYNKCKKVVDGFKYNNVLFRDHRDLAIMPDQSLLHTQRTEAKFKELQEYARVVQEDHFELKAYVEHMLTMLKQRSAT